MSRIFLVMAAVILSAACKRTDKPAATANENSTPMMVSFAELKWT